MRYHLFQKFFGKMVKIKETSFPSTKGMYLSCHGCIVIILLYSNLDKGTVQDYMYVPDSRVPHPLTKQVSPEASGAWLASGKQAG